MKIKKYTNGAWADLDKPVKKFATYTDEATTLPLTIEVSATDAIENYQVYGRTVVNLANAILEHANIGGDGIIMNPGLVDPEEDKYVLYTAPVESGKTYTITTSEYDGAVVYAIYSTQPAYGVQSYDNARTVLQGEHQATVTAPITGWIAFRDHITAPVGMIVEGSAPAPIYVPPGTSGGVGEETENLVTEIIQNATINSSGTLVTSSTYNASIAPITSGKTYTLLRDYNLAVGTTHYAFFANLPVKGSTSYDRNRNSTEQVSATFTAPITGYVVVLNKEGKSTVVEGNTAIPYGYKIPLTVESDTYPLYIGDSKLGEDEYLDYGEQKIYKDVSGTLTPTDPPEPFPTLTAYLGENCIDVDTTVAPEKVVLEYKGWKGVGEPQIYDGGEWKDEPS